jgi:hypothetical protein
VARRAALACLIAAAAFVLTPSLPWLDDGYISLDSAQSLLSGGDVQYGSSPLTGVTSPPYVLLLALLLQAGMAPLLAMRIASALGLAALAGAVWWLGRSVGLDGWRRWALPLAVLTAGPVIAQATNGVETGWAMAVATALIAACIAEQRLAVAVLAGLLPWLRPDLLPLAGVVLLLSIWRQPASVGLKLLIAAAIAFVPWSVWVRVDTGAWIPQTMAAKAAFFAQSCYPLPLKASIVGQALAAWFTAFLPAGLLGAIFVLRGPVGRLALAASIVTIAAYTAILPSGLFHNYHRYLYPIGVPLLALGLAVSFSARAFVWRVGAIAVIAGSLLLWPTRQLGAPSEPAERLAAAAWVTEHVDPAATLLVQDAGVFSVFTPNPLVDLVGLKTPASVAVHQARTEQSCGANRLDAVAAIAKSSRAGYLIVTSNWDATFSLIEGLRERGATLELLRFPPNSPDDGYNVYRMRYPP